MNKKFIALILLTFVLCILTTTYPVAAAPEPDHVNESSYLGQVSLYPTIHTTEAYAIPAELFYVFMLLAAAFLITALKFATNCQCPSPDAIAISGGISMLFWFVCAYANSMVAIFDVGFVSSNLAGATIPYAMVQSTWFFGGDYLLYLCIMLGIIAMAVMFYGIVMHIRIRSELTPKKNF